MSNSTDHCRPENRVPVVPVYVLVCDNGYDGDTIYGAFTDYQEARREAYTRQEKSFGGSFYVQCFQGLEEKGERWYAPKKPTEPKLPADYLKAVERHKAQTRAYEEARKEFEG